MKLNCTYWYKEWLADCKNIRTLSTICAQWRHIITLLKINKHQNAMRHSCPKTEYETQIHWSCWCITMEFTEKQKSNIQHWEWVKNELCSWVLLPSSSILSKVFTGHSITLFKESPLRNNPAPLQFISEVPSTSISQISEGNRDYTVLRVNSEKVNCTYT